MTSPTFIRHAHCSYCGSAFPADAGWPRVCVSCTQVTYRNPLPVAVVLLPVGDGLLLIRRGIEPRRGFLALPGGYIDYNEPWQQAAARELFEETGIVIDPASLTVFDLRSAPDNTLVVFALAPAIDPASLPEFEICEVTLERVVAPEPREGAFSMHTDVLREFFARTRL